jgi:hypothetical protein
MSDVDDDLYALFDDESILELNVGCCIAVKDACWSLFLLLGLQILGHLPRPAA